MKLHIVARGRIGRSAEGELVRRYLDRIRWPTAVTELPDSGGAAPAEPPRTTVVGLSEEGALWSSTNLADRLGRWREDGVAEARFLIGAADGLSTAERERSGHLLSFGRATWPHLLARAMLAEQLYRATAILAGHPYHRDG